MPGPPRQLPLFGTGVGEFRVLDTRERGTRFVTVPFRTVLNAPEHTGMEFWSLNPYVGCEFGCTYCYARHTHRYTVERARERGAMSSMAFEDYRGKEGWEGFERRILVKQGAGRVLTKTLEPARLAGRTLVIGTATDPYQPAERQFRITRSMLEQLARFSKLNIGIITKSPLVTRDIDVLLELQARSRLTVHISVIGTEAKLIRLFEPRSPLPHARFRALRRLTEAGINAGVIAAPVLPGITDGWGRLHRLMAEARAARACFVHPGPLRLYPAIRDRFLPIIDREFPQLGARYRRAYEGRGAAPRAYCRALIRRFQRLERRYGFPVNGGMQDRYRRDAPNEEGEPDWPDLWTTTDG